MKVVVLCGGKGTRIQDVTSEKPKPMIPVGGYPIIWHIMKYYATYGHKDFILCLGHMGSVIRDFFLNYRANTCDILVHLGEHNKVEYMNNHYESDWKVILAETGVDSMTGARVKKIKKYIADDDTFMLTYGDGVGDIDIKMLLDFHRTHGKIMTVTGVRPPGRFGEMRHDDSGLVSAFNEKPQVTAGRISGGFFVCQKEIFNYLDDNDELVFEQEPMRELVADNQMMIFQHDGFWQPMDTHREYLLLNGLYNAGTAPWVKWNV